MICVAWTIMIFAGIERFERIRSPILVDNIAIKSTQKENGSFYMAYPRRMPGLQQSV